MPPYWWHILVNEEKQAAAKLKEEQTRYDMGQTEDHYMRDMTALTRQKAGRRAIQRRKKRNRVYLARLIAFLIVFLSFSGAFLLVRTLVRHVTGNEQAMETVLDQKVEKLLVPKRKKVFDRPVMQEDFLTANPYSRPQEALLCVKSVFVHYTANAGTSAAQNRSYFEGLAQSGETSASAHFIIGYDGEIIQCLPLDEIGYAVKGRNFDSVSTECCYLDDSGKFTDATYQSLIQLTAWLLGQYDLTETDILRHYDEGGKNCPKYYVEHEEVWERFQKDVADYIDTYGSYVQEE